MSEIKTKDGEMKMSEIKTKDGLSLKTDDHGKVAIYLKTSKTVKYVHSIDAREIVASGEGSFDIPDETSEVVETVDEKPKKSATKKAAVEQENSK